MKIGVCVSNEIPNFKGRLLNVFRKEAERGKKDWSAKFAEALSKEMVEYGYVYMDKDNWVEQIMEYDILIWKPKFMGIYSSQFFKEKIYFIQYIMGKRIYPNYETVWHFDSKVAQKYIFEYRNIKSPKTITTFDYNEAIEIAENATYPIVLKKSSGAGSTGVRLVKSKKNLSRKINYEFIGKKIFNKIFNMCDRFGYLYVQEFIPNNKADLRINIIGSNYAIGFWRINRENDFRASGSGKIDYRKKVPIKVIEYCANISRENNFDSMAYDILFINDDFVITEMSYGYIDKAVYNSEGYYLLNDNGNVIEFIEGNYWPQELWVKWVLSSKDFV